MVAFPSLVVSRVRIIITITSMTSCHTKINIFMRALLAGEKSRGK